VVAEPAPGGNQNVRAAGVRTRGCRIQHRSRRLEMASRRSNARARGDDNRSHDQGAVWDNASWSLVDRVIANPEYHRPSASVNLAGPCAVGALRRRKAGASEDEADFDRRQRSREGEAGSGETEALGYFFIVCRSRRLFQE